MFKDPSVWGLIAGVGYAAAILASALAAMKSSKTSRYWIAASFTLIALCAIRVLGLQVQVAEFGREAVRQAGLYGDRGSLQTVIMLGIAVALVAGAAFGLVRLRRMSPALQLAGFGLLVIVGLNAARAVSLHSADAMLRRAIGPLNLGLAIEIVGLAVILAGAGYVVLKRPKKTRRRRS